LKRKYRRVKSAVESKRFKAKKNWGGGLVGDTSVGRYTVTCRGEGRKTHLGKRREAAFVNQCLTKSRPGGVNPRTPMRGGGRKKRKAPSIRGLPKGDRTRVNCCYRKIKKSRKKRVKNKEANGRRCGDTVDL